MVAGDSGDALPADHLCSMGAGAGMPSRSIISRRGGGGHVLQVRAGVGLHGVPRPETPPRTRAAAPAVEPQDAIAPVATAGRSCAAKNSASAAFTRLTCSRSSGATFSSASRAARTPCPRRQPRARHCLSSRRIVRLSCAARAGSSRRRRLAARRRPPARGSSPPPRRSLCAGSTCTGCAGGPRAIACGSCARPRAPAVHVFSTSLCAFATRRSPRPGDAEPRFTPHRATVEHGAAVGVRERQSHFRPSQGHELACQQTRRRRSGGTVAPVSCAPTCVNPAICCSRMLA